MENTVSVLMFTGCLLKKSSLLTLFFCVCVCVCVLLFEYFFFKFFDLGSQTIHFCSSFSIVMHQVMSEKDPYQDFESLWREFSFSFLFF